MQELDSKKTEKTPLKARKTKATPAAKAAAAKKKRVASKQNTLFEEEALNEQNAESKPKPSQRAKISKSTPKSEQSQKSNRDGLSEAVTEKDSNRVLADNVIKKTGFGQFEIEPSLLKALESKNFSEPNETQKQLFPLAFLGRDIATVIPQGQGKTAFFLVSAAQRLLSQDVMRGESLSPAVLILVSNKDAALKGQSHAGRLLGSEGITATAIFENGDLQRQEGALKQGVDILFATPARALEFIEKGFLNWSKLSMLLVDDLSELLKFGSGSDVEYLFKSLIKKRIQSIFLSTWWNSWSYKMAETYLLKPQFINVKRGAEPRLVGVEHFGYVMEAESKFQTLLGTLREEKKFTLIYANTKIVADWIAYKLALNSVKVEVNLNPLTSERRTDIAKYIENGKLHALVVVEGVLPNDFKTNKPTNVINFDVPDNAQQFLNRADFCKESGGKYISFICDDYGQNMVTIESEIEHKVPVKQVPEQFKSIEDKSDFPFDAETGRVKFIPNQMRVIPVPQPVIAPAAPVVEKPAVAPQVPGVAIGMDVQTTAAGSSPRSQATAPAHIQNNVHQKPRDSQQSHASPQPANLPVAATGANSQNQQRPAFQQKPYQDRHAQNGSAHGSNQSTNNGYVQHKPREERYDERARETAEAAREAARQAARRQAKPAKVGYERPEGGIVDLATETFHTAVELVQIRITEALEDALVPPLSRLLERLKTARDRRR